MPRGAWFRKHTRNGATKPDIPEGLWNKCPRCDEILFGRDVERNVHVCPKCDYHHRLTAQERLSITADPGSFEEIDGCVTSTNPLDFPGYPEKVTRDTARTGLSEATLSGRASIDGRPVLLSIADFGFMGGSMGSATGEKLARLMERGEAERRPVVLFTASGGARMQEGLLSLMQMAKTSAAAARLDRAAVPYIVVLTNPTTGGVYASYASLGDVILAEPGATVAFAGRRVGQHDVGAKLPDDFQTSEFQFRCGMLDRIVHRKELRPTLSRLLAFFAENGANAQEPA